MAIITCSCSSKGGNTGYPNCEVVFGTMAGFYAVPMKADDGTANKILLTDTINQVYWDALVQNTDPSKRYYPIHEVRNIATERAESVKFTYEDGTSVKIEDGVRTFSGILNQRSFTFLSKLKEWECINMGVVPYDQNGNIVMELSTDGLSLVPIQVSDNTWDVLYKFGTSTDPSQITMNFQVAKNVKDYQLKMILASEMDGIDVADSDGLLDVNGVFSTPTATGVVAALTTDYGTAMSPTDVEGLLVADLEVRNVDTGTTYTPTISVESPAGTYTITYPTAPAGDYQLEIDTTKGYEEVVVGTWTIV